MISVLQFNITTNESYKSPQPIPFKPNVNGVDLSGDTIYISSTAIITLDDIKQYNKEGFFNTNNNNTKNKNLFTSLNEFKKFMDTLKKKQNKVLTEKNKITFPINTLTYDVSTDNKLKTLLNDASNNKSNLNSDETELNNANAKITEILTTLDAQYDSNISNNKKLIEQLEADITKETTNTTTDDEQIKKWNKTILEKKNTILQNYYAKIKIINLRNEESKKKNEELQKKNEELQKKNEELKKKEASKEFNQTIQENENEINENENEIKNNENKIQENENNIKENENDIKDIKTNIENETNETAGIKKDVLDNLDANLKTFQTTLDSTKKKLNDTELNLKKATLDKNATEKEEYEKARVKLQQDQSTTQTKIDELTKQKNVFNKKFDDKNTELIMDARTKTLYNYNKQRIDTINFKKKAKETTITNTNKKIYELKQSVILNNNIKLVKNLFFTEKEPIKINDKKYIIYKIKDISKPPYIPDATYKNTDPSNNDIQNKYLFNLELSLVADSGSFLNIDYHNLSCMEKAKTLQKAQKDASNNFGIKMSNYIVDFMKPIEYSKPIDINKSTGGSGTSGGALDGGFRPHHRKNKRTKTLKRTKPNKKYMMKHTKPYKHIKSLHKRTKRNKRVKARSSTRRHH
jgi:hypothetical protein